MQDNKESTAVIPVSVQEEPSNRETDAPSEATPPRRHAGAFAWRRMAATALSAVTLAVLTGSTVLLLAESEPASHPILRHLLAPYLGGADNIAVTPADVAAYDDTQSSKNPTAGVLHPLDAILQENSTRRETLGSDTLTLSNETPYDPDLDAIAAMARVIPPSDALVETHGPEAPLVLILHTHATEAFADTAADGYRSTDTARNVVSLGALIADKLTEAGIATLHVTTLFDAEDFTMAYYNASRAIRETLEAYPSIAYILDIHRDSIESDGTYIAPSVDTDDGTTAQMMFVVGTDYGGSGHTTWQNNLSLAVRLQLALNTETPQVMRDINLRRASFNAQFSDGSLLLEIGSCASTTDEVTRAASLFADALIAEIHGERTD